MKKMSNFQNLNWRVFTNLNTLAIVFLFLCVTSGEMKKFDIFPKIPNIINYGSNKLCLRESSIYETNLKNYTLWAHTMLESSTKRSFGVLAGNNFQLGNHNECLNVNGPFPTQYCVLTLTIKAPIVNMTENSEGDPYRSIFSKLQKPRHGRLVRSDNVRMGLCFPLSCTAHDIENSLTQHLRITDPPYQDLGVTYTIAMEDSMCISNSTPQPFRNYEIIFCSLSAVLILLILLATLTEHKTIDGYPMLNIFWLSCSAKKTLRNLFRAHEDDEDTRIFDGIRSIALLLIVTAHKGEFTINAPWLNGDNLNKLAHSKLSYLYEQLDLLVTTFFVISALLLSYGVLKKAEQVSLNPFVVILLRYIRLTPLNAYVTFYLMSLHNLTRSGPLWNLLIPPHLEVCRNYWWTNILYINTFVLKSNNMCNIVTWYVSCDFQLFILGTFVMFVVLKNKRVGYAVFAILFSGFIITPYAITLIYKIQPRQGMDFDEDYFKFLDLLYFQSYNHGSCYIIGMFGGILYHKMKNNKIRVAEKLSYSILIVSISFMVISSGYLLFFYNGYENYLYEFPLYNALHRPVWSIGILGLFIVTSFGTAESIRSFLSASFWIPFSKLSYAVYMVHLLVITIRVASTTTVIQPTIFNMGASLICDIVLSLFLALFLHIFVEMPPVTMFRKFLLSKYYQNKKEKFENKGTICEMLNEAANSSLELSSLEDSYSKR